MSISTPMCVKRYYRLDATDLGTPWTLVPLCARAPWLDHARIEPGVVLWGRVNFELRPGTGDNNIC